MKGSLYSVNYGDKHAAALVFRSLKENYERLKLHSLGLEKSVSKTKNKTYLKIIISIDTEIGQNLPSLLRSLHADLKDHPLYPYVSFDFNIVPISHLNWNFDSYDDPNYQKIFIIKRGQ